MIIRDTGQNITSATLPFRLARAGLVVLNQRLTGGVWLALLSVMGFSAVCAVVWMNSDQIVAWLLANGIVEEASTSTLPTWINRGAFRAATAGLVAAALIILRAVFGIYPWSPLLTAAYHVEKRLRPVTSPILHKSVAVLGYITIVAATLARYMGNGLLVIGRSLRTGAAAAGHITVKALVLFSAGARAIFAPLQSSCLVLASGLRAVWATVSAILAHVWRWFVSLLILLEQATISVAQHIRRTIAAVICPIRLMIAVASQRAARMWNMAVVSLVKLRQGVATVLRYMGSVLWIAMRQGIAGVGIPLSWAVAGLVGTAHWTKRWVVTVIAVFDKVLKASLMMGWMAASTAVRPIKYGATRAAEAIKLAVRLAASGISLALALVRAIAFAVVRPFGYLARTIAMVMVIAAVVLATAITRVIGLLARTLSTVFAVLRVASSTVARPIWGSTIAAAGFLKLLFGLASHGIAVQLGLLWKALSVVTLITGHALSAVVGVGGNALSTLARIAGNALSAAARISGHALSAVARVAGNALSTVACIVGNALSAVALTAGNALSDVALIAGQALSTVFVPIWLGISLVAASLIMAGAALIGYLKSVLSLVAQAGFRLIRLIISVILSMGWPVYLVTMFVIQDQDGNPIVAAIAAKTTE